MLTFVRGILRLHTSRGDRVPPCNRRGAFEVSAMRCESLTLLKTKLPSPALVRNPSTRPLPKEGATTYEYS